MAKSEKATSAEEFLSQYRRRYQQYAPVFEARAKSTLKPKRKKRGDVPEIPQGKAPTNWELCKWFKNGRDGIIAFFDDEKDLPDEANLIIFSHTNSIVSKAGFEVTSETWLFRLTD